MSDILFYMPPQLIRAIRTADGKISRSFAATPSNNISADAVAELIDVMQDVVKRGTGTQASLPGIAVAGKTGTTDGARDIWFCVTWRSFVVFGRIKQCAPVIQFHNRRQPGNKLLPVPDSRRW
jgi:membrane peptidoglycan carboxypeptidase